MQKPSIHFYQFEIFAIKFSENNKKICHMFHHNFKNIPCYVMSEVSLKKFHFALFEDGLTLKTLKLAFIGFCIQTLYLLLYDFGDSLWVHIAQAQYIAFLGWVKRGKLQRQTWLS